MPELASFKVRSGLHTICLALILIAGGGLFALCVTNTWLAVISDSPDLHGDYNMTDVYIGLVIFALLWVIPVIIGIGTSFLGLRFLWVDIQRITVDDDGLVTFHTLHEDGDISLPAAAIKSVFRKSAKNRNDSICFRCTDGETIETRVFQSWPQLLVRLKKFNSEIPLIDRPVE